MIIDHYWFPKRGHPEQVCDPNRSLSALDHIMNDIDDRVVQLYMLISYDVVRKCNLPFDFIEFEGLVCSLIAIVSRDFLPDIANSTRPSSARSRAASKRKCSMIASW